MQPSYYYTVFQTPLGWCGLVRGERGLRRVIFPLSTAGETEECIRAEFPQVCLRSVRFNYWLRAFKRYFHRERVSFLGQIDLSGKSNFSRAILLACRRIPYGEIRSYGWLARVVGRPKAARPVGNVLARNPLPLVIPCHRVVKADGTLGGFSARGGLSLKARLLQLEGIRIPLSGHLRKLT